MKALWIRRVAIGVLGLVVLLAALATWFVASFDADKYKGLAIERMKREHDRTLVIDGPLKLSVFPRLGLKVSKLSLSERGRSDVFIALDEAALAVEVLPLLSKRLVIDRVSARGLRVVYTRNLKGERNFDDLLEKPSKQGQAESTTGGASGLQFDVSRVQLEDLHATVRDELGKVHGELAVVSLTSGRLAPGIESPVQLKARLALTQPLLKGELKGETRLAWAPNAGTITATGMKLSYQGQGAGVDAIDASMRGGLSWHDATGALHAKSLELDLASALLGPLKLAGSKLALDAFSYDATGKALTLSKLQLKVAGSSQGKTAFALSIDWPALDVTGQTLKGTPFTGTLTLAGDNSIDGRFQSGPPSGNFDELRLPGFALSLKGKGGPRQVDGTLKSDLLLRAAQRALAFERLDLQARIDEPNLQPLVLEVRGSALASAQRANWNLTGHLSDNSFASDGVVSFAGRSPHVQMQARFDSLDLNKLLAPPKAASASSAPPRADNTPLDLSGLQAVDGKFALRAGRFAFRQYRFNETRIDASLDAGMLQVQRLQGRAWNGTLDASGFADSRAQRLGVKLNATGVDVNALLKDVATSDRLEGTGRVSADLLTAGKSVGAMRSQLRGNAALQLRDGAIKGVNLAKNLRQAKAALGIKRDTVQRASQSEKTDFSELSATFQIADGVARNNDLEVKSPFLRIGGAGVIDVGNERIDYTAHATVTDTSKGQDGAELAALQGLTVPVKISGPLEAMDWSIQWSAVAAGAVRAKVEDTLREKLGERLGMKPAPSPASAPSSAPMSQRDKLKETLKGLMR